jgi:hypothetical protein
MRAYSEEESKRICLIAITIVALTYGFFLVMTFLELTPGLDAGHPSEYLFSTFIAVGSVVFVLLLMWYFDIVRMPIWFTALLAFNLYYYSISMFFGMYLRVSWWGDVAHCISSMCVTAVVFLGLCVVQAHSPGHVTLGSVKGLLALQFLIGVCLGGVWEIMEGYVDIITGTSYMVYGVRDTLFDLRADTVGTIIMVIVGYFFLKKYTVEQIADTTKVVHVTKKNRH